MKNKQKKELNIYAEKKEERDAALKKVRELKQKALDELMRLSDPALRVSKLSKVCDTPTANTLTCCGRFST